MVLLDIGQDPDDQQSLIRLLYMQTEFDLEGLIACSDINHNEPALIRTDLIKAALGRYAQILPNLRLHSPDYRDASDLLSLVKSGNNLGGRDMPVFDTIGEGKDTEGSDWIIQQADKADPRPLNIALWGGAADLAQALWKIRETRSPEEVAAFLKRLRVFAISDQDSTNPWIYKEFPELFFVRSLGETSIESAFRGMYLGGDYESVSFEWVMQNIINDHGPLGAYYPARAHTQRNPSNSLKEGDTPSFFYFLQNGLQDPEKPEYGGWGGRYTKRGQTFYGDSPDTVGDTTHVRATVWRWRTHYQNDFAARLDWGVMPYEEANHHPKATLNGDQSRDILYQTVTPGEAIQFSAQGSTDPDGDTLGYKWWIYPEAGTCQTIPEISNPTQATATLTTPHAQPGETLHIILEVTDTGAPNLTAFRRLVLQFQ